MEFQMMFVASLLIMTAIVVLALALERKAIDKEDTDLAKWAWHVFFGGIFSVALILYLTD